MNTILYFFAVVCSILSNFPVILDAGLDGPLKIVWVFPFFYNFIVKDIRVLWSKEIIPFYALVIFFSLYCEGCQAVFGREYVGTDLKNILISSLIAITSYAYWKDQASDDNLEKLSYLLLGCGLLLGLYVYFEYLVNNNLMDRVYAVNNKNSIAQIIFCCTLIPFLSIKKHNNILKYSLYSIAAVLTLIVFMIKSRATIIGVFWVITYFIFSRNTFKTKIWLLGVSAVIILVILFNDSLYNIVINGILFSGRNSSSLNDLSSGRVVLISQCIEGISKNFWFGNGNRYMDCMPIIMLYQYGFWGALMVFAFLANIAYHVTFRMDRTSENSVNLIAYLLFGCFMLNSLFEAQPPFGPGIKCFLLWVFIGFSLANVSKQIIENN